MGLEMRYFVLKPSAEGEHGRASRAALRTYARMTSNASLAHDLNRWADDEQAKTFPQSEMPFPEEGG